MCEECSLFGIWETNHTSTFQIHRKAPKSTRKHMEVKLNQLQKT